MMMMMHTTFFWGKGAESFNLYVLELILVFVLSMLVEWLSYTPVINNSGMHNVAAGTLQSLMYGVRIGVAYLLMLAVMSFNVGVLLVSVAGHSVGFLLFGSRVFEKSDKHQSSDLPPLMSCC